MINKRLAASKELEQFRAGLELPTEPRIIEDVGGRKRFAPEKGKPGELVFPEVKVPAKAKGPSAGTIARFYSSRDKFQKEIDEATEKIDFMRSDWKLDLGELPRKRKDLDNWNRTNKQLSTAQASLDSLRQKATEVGVDLTIGERAFPTPEEVSGMSLEEIKQGIFPDIE